MSAEIKKFEKNVFQHMFKDICAVLMKCDVDGMAQIQPHSFLVGCGTGADVLPGSDGCDLREDMFPQFKGNALLDISPHKWIQFADSVFQFTPLEFLSIVHRAQKMFGGTTIIMQNTLPRVGDKMTIDELSKLISIYGEGCYHAGLVNSGKGNEFFVCIVNLVESVDLAEGGTVSLTHLLQELVGVELLSDEELSALKLEKEELFIILLPTLTGVMETNHRISEFLKRWAHYKLYFYYDGESVDKGHRSGHIRGGRQLPWLRKNSIVLVDGRDDFGITCCLKSTVRRVLYHLR